MPTNSGYTSWDVCDAYEGLMDYLDALEGEGRCHTLRKDAGRLLGLLHGKSHIEALAALRMAQIMVMKQARGCVDYGVASLSMEG